MCPESRRWSVPPDPADQVLATEGENDDLGDDEGEGRGPLPGGLRRGGRGQARITRVEGLHGLPRPDRGGPGVGDLRLGRGGLDGVRHGPRDPRDPAGSRSPRPALAGSVPRDLLRLAGRARGSTTCLLPTPTTHPWSWWAAA